MYQVRKRDGQIIEFNLSKIAKAITAAFDAKNKPYTQDIIDLLALKVTSDFMDKVSDGVVSVEDIQDSVETVLIQAGYAEIAKAYILYRKNHENVRNVGETILDYKSVVDNYLKIADWRVKENSTVTYSVGGLILSNSGAITANYWLSSRRIGRRSRKNNFRSRKAPCNALQPNGQLPGNYAKRMGGRSGVQFFRYVSRSFCKSG